MYLTQAKGLEFRDVLVWNFWSGSEMVPQRWRVIYEFLGELKEEFPSDGIQEFDASKHGQLCRYCFSSSAGQHEQDLPRTGS